MSYGYILNTRPRFSIEESENLLKMLRIESTYELAAGILADNESLLPWRYMRDLKRILCNDPMRFRKREIIANQCNKRSRIEKKKIYGEGAQ